MRTYQMLNITGNDIEERVVEAIRETKEELHNLTTERTCKIYSDSVARNLMKRHVIQKRIYTKKYNYSYDHQFNIVPITEKLSFLIDLCYSQFGNEAYPDLLKKGYQLIPSSELSNYLGIVGQGKDSVNRQNNRGVSSKKR